MKEVINIKSMEADALRVIEIIEKMPEKMI